MKKFSITNYFRKDYLQFEEYKAVPSAYDRGTKNKLDANENGFGPSKKLYSALSDFKEYQFYPDPEYKLLRTAIERYVGLSKKYIAVGSGGDELIDLILRLLLEPGDQVVNCPPTFGSYETSTFLNRGVLVAVPRKNDFSIQTEKVIESINKKTKLVIICNPNNPTGNVTNIFGIKKILDTGRPVLIDEAYFEFSGITILPLIRKYPNLIILRTFSKWAGIAGLRLGYCIASPILISELMRIKLPYNVNAAAELAGLIALNDKNYKTEIIKKIIKERERLYRIFKKNKGIIAYPSYGNFLFIKCNKSVFSKLNRIFRKNKIAVRSYTSILTGNAFRISIGTPSENNKILQIINNL